MSRFSSRFVAVIAGLAIVLVVSQMAVAQPPEGGRGEGGRGGGGPSGGMGGPGMMSSVDLAGIEPVQAVLKLSDEQKTKVKEITDKLREDRRELRQGSEFNREELDKLNHDAAAKLAEVFDESQQQRLVGILAQISLGAALNEPSVVKELNITDEQKKKLAEVADENRQSMRGLRDLSPEERREKMGSLRTEAEKRILAVLTSDQQTQLEQLKGEKFELDMSRLFGRGGPGGRGEGGPGRGGRRGERGERGPRPEGGAPDSTN
jgi:Spy/CpxP family protein refolding chaperone